MAPFLDYEIEVRPVLSNGVGTVRRLCPSFTLDSDLPIQSRYSTPSPVVSVSLHFDPFACAYGALGINFFQNR